MDKKKLSWNKDELPTSQVELSVSCRNIGERSNTMVIFYTKSKGTNKWIAFGRTEKIENNPNPNFVKKFVTEYFFEESQKLQFEVCKVQSGLLTPGNQTIIGTTECTLAEIVSSVRVKKDLKLNGNPATGMIVLSAEELQNCKEEVTMQWSAKNIESTALIGKPNTYLLFSRSNEGGTCTVVHKTEEAKNTTNPVWKSFTITARLLCNGDHDRPIIVECYNGKKDGSHDLIGSFTTSLREIEQGPGAPGSSNTYECINQAKKSKKGDKYKHSGLIELLSCNVQTLSTFLDFIQGGCEIHCSFAIDFTASNGDPSEPTSLHYNHPNQLNQYQIALLAVGDIIQDYDSDKLFPAFGFGARIPPDDKISHDFPLTGEGNNPFCVGIEGILEAYKQTLDSVNIFGPTNFAPSINRVAKMARENQDGKNYFILLIITDGVITDMPQTCEAIVQASSLPLSIVIVGVGNEDFEAMRVIDGDDVRLSSKGKFAERDIVQFVPFNDFVDTRGNVGTSQARLAKEVLAEIPDQFLSYMKSRSFKPMPPLNRQDSFPVAPPAYDAIVGELQAKLPKYAMK